MFRIPILEFNLNKMRYLLIKILQYIQSNNSTLGSLNNFVENNKIFNMYIEK